MDALNGRRIKFVFAVFAALMTLLAARVWYIQAACGGELSEAAVSQYEIAIEGLDTRGMILDRNLKPLTGGTKQYYYIISKRRGGEELEELMKEAGGRQLAKASSAYYVYRTEKYSDEINAILKSKYGAYVFQSQSRYADEQTACHLLGYLNKDENRGVSGLELAYQDELSGDGSVLTVWADGAGNIIRGIAPSVKTAKAVEADSSSPKAMKARSVVTSIDRRVQRVCEKALKGAGEGGAAVVMNCRTGEIIAWASYPDFNPNDIAAYLKGEGDCLIDKVSQGAYAPGSVFKIITAAAAIESGVCDETQIFRCDGEVTIGGVTLKCTAAEEEGHGELNMSQAMACSCNCYFAKLGQLTGSAEIIKTAEKFGLGREVMQGYPGETPGNIPSEDELGPWDITNISIGQGEILATPLQIAKMTAVVAGGGMDVNPNLEVRSGSAEAGSENKGGDLKPSFENEENEKPDFEGGETLKPDSGSGEEAQRSIDGETPRNFGEETPPASEWKKTPQNPEEETLQNPEGAAKIQTGRRIISRETAEKLDSMLRKVMTDGTGAGDWRLPVRGKTGTAEAVFEGRDVKNCWFTGYFKAGDEIYSAAIVAERGDSGSYTAMPVFRAVVDFFEKNMK